MYDRIYIDIEERYVKQTYRNRCSVLTANKVDQLTVPVQKYETAAPTKDIKIDYGQDWLRRHLGCLQSAYGKSPFYEFYAPELLQIYDKKLAYLVDLNYELLTICLRLVGVKKDLQYNLSGLEMEESSVFNAISLINNKKSDFSPEYYKPEHYYQTFGNDFVSNLSIIDLLFNMGPEARSVLLRSCKFQ
ncbi:WbqC family protein [Dyadobacter chenhuakuii]|uniref:WbqC family protein n=2 Tax=Dyadobacter chenhuakuii TaxID=2909339 RepID=A0ABY4XSV9_9BACT|nr:WbqC family protein [Dyadobacter chenhuakuii]USJ33480.1 WbqC family protein [Dyadobacter chenhuakuii]